MPYYGHSRPSADYFNSNLMTQNFVVADITNGIKNVYFYDERGKDKNADAVCSLPEVNFSLLDNCVGQNKSKVKVVLCFLLPGHSHNIADRVIAWCRRATRGLNLYTPMDLVKKVNEVKSVNGTFIDHNAPDRPFFVEWGTLLAKYFTPLPAGYTANYLFEIDKGICTARKTVNTPDVEAIVFATVDSSNDSFTIQCTASSTPQERAISQKTEIALSEVLFHPKAVPQLLPRRT
ncbi:uncharacterized protein PITG_10803 [Phytophthora infestans T30-4]|uniref:Uncharacterized protein n=1 Tax=Phytophthora infestans (strain T30-4) TaxID=403677 RepID=D0NH45_PHYIT|nr:uncharacterized protein PITG_10803 [Phytophthora infestans T30-4]EEY58684.1 conserved hypothetical protein [Phytophthora infestans T30-4]|eukprot:XP_002901628.1 conserved hypothetical protein [Phytophthora infestans T30-4]